MKYFPHILLSLFLTKILIFGTTTSDGICLFSLCLLTALSFYLEHKKEPEVNKEIKEKLLALEEKIQKQENKVGALMLNNQRR